MAYNPINPTQITPPRVSFIDERSGAISREWYRFFLSLVTAVQTNQDETELAPSASSLLASYDAMLETLAQTVETAPDANAAAADVDAKVNALTQTVGAAPAGASESDIASLQTQLQALSLSPPPRQYRTPRYGSFFSTLTQTAAAINTAYPITFDTVDLSYGVTRGTPTSRVYVDRQNIYNIQFSAQIDKTLGGVGLVWVWLRKNGVNVPESTGQIRIQGNNAEALAAWNYIIQLNDGDYIEMMWEVDDTSVILLAEAATAVHPAVPSIIMTVTDNISTLET